MFSPDAVHPSMPPGAGIGKANAIDSSSADIQVTLSPTHSPSPTHPASPPTERRAVSRAKDDREEEDELHSTPGSVHNALPPSPVHSHHSLTPKLETAEITQHDIDAEGEEELEAGSVWSVGAPASAAPIYEPYIPGRDIPYALRSASLREPTPLLHLAGEEEDDDMAAQYPSSPHSPILSVSQALGAVFSPVSLARYALSPSRSPSPLRPRSRLSVPEQERTPSPSIASAHLYAKPAGRASEWERPPKEVEGLPSSMKRRYVDLEREAVGGRDEKRYRAEGVSARGYWNRDNRPTLRLSSPEERELRASQQARELARRRMELEVRRAGTPSDGLRLAGEERGRGMRRPEGARGRSPLTPSPRAQASYRAYPCGADRHAAASGRERSTETDVTPLRLPLPPTHRADRPYPLTHRPSSQRDPDQLSAREWFVRNRVAEEVGRERTLRQAEMGAGRHPFVARARAGVPGSNGGMEEQERLIRLTRDAYALDLRRRGAAGVMVGQGQGSMRPVGAGGSASENGSVGPSSPSSSSQNSARKRVDDEQLAVLHQAFNKSAYPPTAEREALGRKLGMTSRSVQIWFQNRRRAVKVEKESAIQKAELEAAAAARAAGGRAPAQAGGAVPMPFGGR